MNGAPTAQQTAVGKVKPSVTGKKGNVGGKVTPGRPGSLSTALAMKNLVKPGAGTKKTADVSKIRPEGAVKINVGPKGGSGSVPSVVAGSPKSLSAGSGHSGVQVGTRPEGPIKRDVAGVVKPKMAVKS